jgi:hypothetical protein
MHFKVTAWRLKNVLAAMSLCHGNGGCVLMQRSTAFLLP